MTRKRIDLIDAVRGLALILMVAHHFLYDLVVFLGAPGWLFTNPVLDVFHWLFAGTFIVLSGVSSQFSRSNMRRGLRVFAIAMGITLVTWFIDMPVRFGVLHLLGFCMVFYALTRKFWDALPRAWAPLLYISLTAASAYAVNHIAVNSAALWVLGWTYPGFYSSDYFPLFPWLFVFLFGTWAGLLIVDNKFPKWFYETKVPVLPAVGKKSLIIYILHQPVLYGIVMVIKHFF